ncbi:MAG: DUF3631 domain-containing protein [Nitrospirota bacterium]
MSDDIDALEGEAGRPLDPPAHAPHVGPLLHDLMQFVRRFVVLSPDQVCVIALWIVHTHAIDAAEATPFLDVTSPEKGSGKTRLLEILELLVARPWRAVAPSEAVLFRKLDRDRPTLLLDEVDAVFGPKAKDHEGLRALLNSGNRRGASVSRCVGKQFDLKDFAVFGPRALAGIGRLPDTIADRSIPLRMVRRTREEPMEGFGGPTRRRAEVDAAVIREQIAEWAAAHVATLKDATPDLPPALSDRTQDGAEPLLAIADAAGGEWPGRARAAVLALDGHTAPDEASIAVRLLADIRSLFADAPSDYMTSEELCHALAAIEDAPWGDWYGKAITPRHLADRLKGFNIRPQKVRTGKDTRQSYRRDQFRETWSRYLPSGPSPSGGRLSGTSGTTPLNQTVIAVCDPEHRPVVPDRNYDATPGNNRLVPDVLDESRPHKKHDARETAQNAEGCSHSYIATDSEPGSPPGDISTAQPIDTLASYLGADDGTGWPREIPGLGPKHVRAFGRCADCGAGTWTTYGARALCQSHARSTARVTAATSTGGDYGAPNAVEPAR